MVKWNRKGGSVIELKDTPNLEKFALSNGWTKAKQKSKATPNGESQNSNK